MIPRFPFTPEALEAVEPPEEGAQRRVLDTQCPGLGLWVGHTGAKVFFAFHWAPGMGKPVEAKIGPYPATSIEDARARTHELVARLSRGEVPDARPGTGRLIPPEDDDALRFPGECKQCLDMTMLNAKGLCGKCRPLPPCAAHPETISAGRCSTCNVAYCDACMSGRRCQTCAAKPAKRGRGGAEAAAAGPKRSLAGLGGLAGDRKVLLGGAVGLLVLVQAAMFGLQFLEDKAGPVATAEDHYKQRVGIVRGAVEAHRAEKKALPADAAALAAYLKAKGGVPPKLARPTSPLPKDAVIYERRDETYELYATTSDGQKYEDATATRAD